MTRPTIHCRSRPTPRVAGFPAILLASALSLAGLPDAAAAQDGSLGAAAVGGLAGGAAALWAFYPYTGCPMVTVGAAQATDACDVGSVVAGLGGLAGGAALGATNADAGYGAGVGFVAGFGVSWLAGKFFDVPRWLGATFVVAGTVIGGAVGG